MVRPRCPARNLLNSTLALVFAFAIRLEPHLCRRLAKLPSVFVSIIHKRTQSECDVTHKVQRQSSAESSWRIPNAVLVAKGRRHLHHHQGFLTSFLLRRINHAAGDWSPASVSQDDFSSYFVSTARNIRPVSRFIQHPQDLRCLRCHCHLTQDEPHRGRNVSARNTGVASLAT
ncbi:hypothetical protein BDP81DRAFT_17919 [Colletotrichum phormii]|uniref:Secreted protein n=1 Tax=Colletotrichum phormii TaxID=359342 RepID=A0AAJ0A4D1_9PEZI|nr:uncharacterized protein BDP81DRAFT_17919 [Colletotrichum phormii]KAK1656255.1 hypothetical protein BDP81DRAFT_17919 [Colletotrichum phormii]